MRKIGVVTVGRSDFGIYLPLLRAIQSADDLELCLIASGSHLAAAHGATIREIEASGIPVAEQLDMLLSADTPQAIAKSMGLGVMGFADVLARCRPDILVVLGDRFEMHAAALAAVPFRIPIAHIHGGEVTAGAMDEAFRHAITKYAHLHFAATQEFSDRIIQLGEEPWRVVVAGALSLDNLHQLELLSDAELEGLIGFPPSTAPLVVTYHPETLRAEQTEQQIASVVEALESWDLPIVVTRPNADTNHQVIARSFDALAARRENVHIVDSLGVRAYFSLMRRARAMVGNSSSGIIEAASFELPVVNIGIRQLGRPRSRNVIDVEHGAESIRGGIQQALDPAFRESLRGMVNLYGAGHSAPRILESLRHVPLDERLILKRFHDSRPQSSAGASRSIQTHTEAGAEKTAASSLTATGHPAPLTSASRPRCPTIPASHPAAAPFSAGDVPCVVLGGGSHARVVIEALQSRGAAAWGILDPDPDRWDELVLGVRVVGGDHLLPQLVSQGIRHFTVGVGSVGSTLVRQAVFARGVQSGLTPLAVVHATAICLAGARIGPGAQVLAGALVGTGASVGENCIVNSGAIVEHDCVLEAHVHISPGVRLAGGVRVGENAHVGIGATVKQGVTIGPRSIVGAGAVIIHDVPADVVVSGVPGRIHKRLAA